MRGTLTRLPFSDGEQLGGSWGQVVDHRWFAIGFHYFSPEAEVVADGWRFGANSAALRRQNFAGFGPFTLTDTPGGRDELRTLMAAVGIRATMLRIRGSYGNLAGTLISHKPAVGMNFIGAMMASGDPRHFHNMQLVSRPARRPTAILFADLEGSSQLARRLPTSTYFGLGRRLVRVADQCIIDCGGLVGRHVGDGVVAFFVAETLGSESAAAHACISAARALREAVNDVALRSGLQPDDVVLRFGLHWGSTLFVGSIVTVGRSEVTALGDEVNEAARIEACATGGRALASKDLIERLDRAAAAALDIDPDLMTYTALTDLPSATSKAIRDARAIAVCDV